MIYKQFRLILLLLKFGFGANIFANSPLQIFFPVPFFD